MSDLDVSMISGESQSVMAQSDDAVNAVHKPENANAKQEVRARGTVNALAQTIWTDARKRYAEAGTTTAFKASRAPRPTRLKVMAVGNE